MEKEEYVLNNKCPTCGASIPFNPKTGKWDCDFCRKSYSLEEMKKHDNASSDKNNSGDSNNYTLYKCKSCGAEIVADEQTAATFCIYCRNTAIIKSKLSGEFKPDYVIPFKKVKQDAVDAFKNILDGRPLAPRDFNNENNIEKLRGVYIPFWLYDINIDGSLLYSAKKITTWSVGDTHYTKTDVYDVLRDASMDYKKVPKDASTRFDDKIMKCIEPFIYSEIKEYNHAYLAGFLAEKYDEDDDKSYPDAKDRAMTTAVRIMLDECNSSYQSKHIKNNTLKASKTKKYYALLPVWMVNVKYHDKPYIFAMNGQTGKFIGNIPISSKRVFAYSLSIFITTFLLGLLLSYLIYLNNFISFFLIPVVITIVIILLIKLFKRRK